MIKKTNVALISSLDGINNAIYNRLKNNKKINIIACNTLENIIDGEIVNAEVIVADPPNFAKSNFIHKSETPKLKFLQSTFAGCDALLKNKRYDYLACRAGGIMGNEIAQYVLTHILAIERKYDICKKNQLLRRWSTEEATYRSHKYVTVGILGVSGDIGQSIANFCTTIGFKTIGWQRNGKIVPNVAHIYQTYEDVLEKSDYIVNILPSTNLTSGLLDDQALSICNNNNNMPPPIFINAGRGDIISEDSIIEALDNHWLGGCVLDVFKQEPLDEHSKLWNRKEITITPHIAGLSFGDDVANVFCKNLDIYMMDNDDDENDGKLNYLFDWDKGY